MMVNILHVKVQVGTIPYIFQFFPVNLTILVYLFYLTNVYNCIHKI